MSIRVICVSRAYAAGGESIGQLVAQGLGFRYIDDEIIALAAREAQVDPALVARAEQRQPLLDRLLEKLPTARGLAAAVSLASGVTLGVPGGDTRAYRALPEDMRAFIRVALQAVGRAGQAVIVAHAGSMALTGVDGVLRVLVTASPATRAQRVAEGESLGLVAATAAVAASDRERREYFQRFYGIADELPTYYDLTINTDLLTHERASDMILAAARAAATV